MSSSPRAVAPARVPHASRLIRDLSQDAGALLLWLAAAGALAFASAVIAYALHRYGLRVVPVAIAVVPLAWAVFAPRSFAVAVLLALVVIEPNALGFTSALSDALYLMPPELARLFPLTISPLECFALLALASIAVRNMRGRRERWRHVPYLAAGIPAVMGLGLMYGVVKGSDQALAYHEMRGLIFAGVAFVLAVELRDLPGRTAARWGLAGTGSLALLLLLRYFLYTRTGEADRPAEFAYAHESVLFLIAGVILGGALLLRSQNLGTRMLLAMHMLLLLGATVATGRRSGTLVLLVAGAMVLLMLWRRRPVGTSVLGVVLLAALVVYLAAYWNQSYGAVAQPARAVRSQFDPNLRDESSDIYRDIEKASIMVSLDASPAFGVGFGRPFFASGQLPPLGFWPLQYFTPHQNILWLWLKMGVVGIATVLAVWMIAMGRCVRTFVTAPRGRPMPVLPLVLGGLLAGYLFFATVDITFSPTRGAVPLGVAFGLALSAFPAWTGRRTADSTTEEDA